MELIYLEMSEQIAMGPIMALLSDVGHLYSPLITFYKAKEQ